MSLEVVQKASMLRVIVGIRFIACSVMYGNGAKIRVLNETSGCNRIEGAYSYDPDDHCCPISLPLKVQNKSATALAAHSIGSSCTGGQAPQSAPQVERRRIIEKSIERQ